MLYLYKHCRYKQMADNVTKAATQGNYTPEDEAALERKAKAIVECYLDSQVHPKVQVSPVTLEPLTKINKLSLHIFPS